MTFDKLFFIYVAKNNEWKKLHDEDWDYVSAMTKFFHWWIKKYFDLNFSVDVDILPVISGKIFDRMSLAYLLRDHDERGKSIFHFYLSYFKPFWTDCDTEGYSSDNFGMAFWDRPKQKLSRELHEKYFADNNCARISHVLIHEVLRLSGKSKKEYFNNVHDVWNEHLHKNLPFSYYDEKFKKISNTGNYRFVTIDIMRIK